MRAQETYRFERRAEAKRLAAEAGVSFRRFWLRSPLRRAPAAKYRPKPGGSKYLPHQGKRECARRLIQSKEEGK